SEITSSSRSSNSSFSEVQTIAAGARPCPSAVLLEVGLEVRIRSAPAVSLVRTWLSGGRSARAPLAAAVASARVLGGARRGVADNPRATLPHPLPEGHLNRRLAARARDPQQ